ncbi:MAG: ExbD/TolR family protein [Vicinamibacterales bacterium]|jgi:biopolymer transport protein ExbD|nr:protein TolR [Acidobacteriota bacterium]MDP6372480.1 ExbD/TolR family protein [Vicinamibacterales bacterium]MDP6608893.1 ExbD/TolR family protein [Vicinamibacterales bacterium]HAK54248.1 protein TolR [Acidobacteriota bacterium]|tara:strand:- start:9110 stop:9547 length:438 start_codon:yes stop_codon:yes gene_type:complete
MAMDLGGAKGGVKSDINVTPLVDVMLVLLIIMMLIAPMLQQGVDVRLPQAANTVDKPETQGQTVLSITADRRFYVNSVQVAETELLNRIQGALEESRERIVLIKGDEDAPYGSIMQLMDELRRVGIEDVGLIVDRRLRAGIGGGQ